MRILPILTPALLLLLAGCAEMVGLPQPAGPTAAPEGVARSTEQGGRFIALVGPRRQFAEAFLGVPNTNFDALRSWIDAQSGERVHQLYVEDSYLGAKRNYEAAHLKSGETLKFVSISNNEITCDNGCSYAEEFAAALPEAVLQAHRQGMTVVFTAKSGPELTIEVPGGAVAKQLAAAESVRAGLPKTAAAKIVKPDSPQPAAPIPPRP